MLFSGYMKWIKHILSKAPLFLFTAVLSATFVAVLNTEIKSSIRNYFIPPYRVILAVASADIDGTGKGNQVLKVKTDQGLFIEVYGSAGKQQELLAMTKLPDKKDGYFTFAGKVTNLAIDDINGDGNPEILATSFDQDLVARLNVYRYLKADKSLTVVQLE